MIEKDNEECNGFKKHELPEPCHHDEYNYLKLVEEVIVKGKTKTDRTGGFV